MATQYIEELKKDAVRYWKEHPELGIGKYAKNLEISKSTLSSLGKSYHSNEGAVPTRRGVVTMKVMVQKKMPISGKN